MCVCTASCVMDAGQVKLWCHVKGGSAVKEEAPGFCIRAILHFMCVLSFITSCKDISKPVSRKIGDPHPLFYWGPPAPKLSIGDPFVK